MTLRYFSKERKDNLHMNLVSTKRWGSLVSTSDLIWGILKIKNRSKNLPKLKI